MNKELIVALVCLVVWGHNSCVDAQTCTSCGPECQSACGTRHFRTCCFNYLRKRSTTDSLPLPLDPAMRLELWLARSRNPAYFQQRTNYDSSASVEVPEVSNGMARGFER